MEPSPAVPGAAQAAATGSVTVALSVAVALIVIAGLLVAQGLYRRRRNRPASRELPAASPSPAGDTAGAHPFVFPGAAPEATAPAPSAEGTAVSYAGGSAPGPFATPISTGETTTESGHPWAAEPVGRAAAPDPSPLSPEVTVGAPARETEAAGSTSSWFTPGAGHSNGSTSPESPAPSESSVPDPAVRDVAAPADADGADVDEVVDTAEVDDDAAGTSAPSAGAGGGPAPDDDSARTGPVDLGAYSAAAGEDVPPSLDRPAPAAASEPAAVSEPAAASGSDPAPDPVAAPAAASASIPPEPFAPPSTPPPSTTTVPPAPPAPPVPPAAPVPSAPPAPAGLPAAGLPGAGLPGVAAAEAPTDAPRDPSTSINPLFRGPGPARGKAGALIDVAHKPYAVIGERDDVAAVLTRLYALTVRGRGTVHVVQLTEAGASDIAAELAVAGAIIGDDPVHRDVTPGRADPVPAPPPGTGPALLGLRRPRLDGPAVRVLREARDAVLVVETGSSRAPAVEEAVAMLDGLGVELLGMIVWQGRVPRDPSSSAPR